MSILEHDNTDLSADAIADQDAADAAALANVPSISTYSTDDMQFTPTNEAFRALSALVIIGITLFGSPAFAFTPPPENPAPLRTESAGSRFKNHRIRRDRPAESGPCITRPCKTESGGAR